MPAAERTADDPQPTFAAALAHHRAGRLVAAEHGYRALLTLTPDHRDALFNLGVALAVDGAAVGALRCLRRAFVLAPTDAAGALGIANLERSRGSGADALPWYRRSLQLNPASPNALASYAAALTKPATLATAERLLRRALAIDPASALAANNLGLVLKASGDTDGAIAAFGRALTLRPDYHKARLHACIAHLPILSADVAEARRRRADYTAALQGLVVHYDRAPHAEIAAAAEAIGGSQPFFLPYQGENDRALQQAYGGLVARFSEARFPAFRKPLPVPPEDGDGRLRIGFVSAHLLHHSVWKITTYGWLDGLDRRRFRPFAYHLADHDDAATTIARALVPDFRDGPRPVEQWAEAILRDRLHVLVYPEIGMDVVTARLAALRLAPVQAIGLGHPQTTGLDTIDYFLSSETMEPAGNEAFYTERLVRFPNMGVRYIPVPLPPATITRAELGAREESVLFACCQSLFKYLPELDHVFPAIARRLPSAQLLFIEHGTPLVTERFRLRLERAFAAQGMDWRGHCVIAPRLDAARFHAMLRCCDLFLDSIGWSGFNSCIEALLESLPVLTLPLTACRARHSAAVLTMIGMTDMIAADLDDYVDKAATLGGSAAARMALRDRVAAAAPTLCRDPAAQLAFERFLVEAVGTARRPA